MTETLTTDEAEISRITGELFAHSDIWNGFRFIILGNFYSYGPSLRVQNELGLLKDEVTILSSLHYWGGLTANVIRALSGRPKNSISRGVIRLAKEGYLESKPDLADRRRVLLRITPEGTSAYQAAADIFRVQENEMFGCLTKRERVDLDRTLRKLLHNWSSRLSTDVNLYLSG